jgi:hypothetical protein
VRLLESQPDCSQNTVKLLADLMIPKPQQLDPMASKKVGANFIANPAYLITMPATVEFDR